MKILHRPIVITLIVMFGVTVCWGKGWEDCKPGLEAKERGEWDNAIQILTRCIESAGLTTGELVEAYKNRGDSWAQKKQLELAIQDYNKVMELNPKDWRPYNNRGIILTNQGQWDQAIQDFNRAGELNPNDYRPYLNRGVAWEGKGQPDRAIAEYDQAIQLNPGEGLPYLNRSRVFSKKGLMDRAREDFNKALAINPVQAKQYYSDGLPWEKKAIVQKTSPVEARAKLAILSMESVPVNEALSAMVEDLFITNLSEKKKYTLLDRSQIKKVLQEWELTQTGTIDQSTAVKMGKALGAQFILTGRVANLGTRFSFSIRILNVETAEVSFSATRMGNSLDEIEQMVRMVCAEISPDFELKGIKLFELSDEILPEEDKIKYSSRFKKDTLRFVGFKLMFRNFLYGLKDHKFSMSVKLINPRGRIKHTGQIELLWKKEWDNPEFRTGYGKKDPGYWEELGQYTYEFYLKDKLIGSASFDVY